jgi:acyl-CoA dehydrogenase
MTSTTTTTMGVSSLSSPSTSSPAARKQSSSSTSSLKQHSAHTIVLVPLPHPNVQMVRPLTVMGYDDAPHGHAEVKLNQVMVSAQDIVLGESYGFQISQARLGPGRIHHCMRAVGIGTLPEKVIT